MVDRLVIAAASMVVLLTGCVADDAYSPAAHQKMQISQYTFSGFKMYQNLIGSVHDGVLLLRKMATIMPFGIVQISIATTGIPS